MADSLTKQVMKALHSTSLMQRADNLIRLTWQSMNIGQNNPKVYKLIEMYKEVKGKMEESEIDNEDLEILNNRFKNLPWKDCGYKIPEIN